MTVKTVGPLEHLIGKRFRSKSKPVMEGVLKGIGCGYFIVLDNHDSTYVTLRAEVTAGSLERRWEPIDG